MIFLDTNVVSETLRKLPNETVVSWLVRNDAEVALPTVTIAEIIMSTALRRGRPMTAPDGMIAAIARAHDGLGAFDWQDEG